MFYSETLLSKTGPLARVWLAANIERKLTKKDVLSSGIEQSVNAIVNEGQAPMALRLSGQLLLGVVRIYSRKARYLLDDCNEALVKIKMAFKPGNVDLPANQAHSANPASLTLPDALTELDLIAPMPDPELLLADASFNMDTLTQAPANASLLSWDSSGQLLVESIENSNDTSKSMPLDDDDLDLDIGDNPEDTTMSVEQGRRAVSMEANFENSYAEDIDPPVLYNDDDLELDIGDEPPSNIESVLTVGAKESENAIETVQQIHGQFTHEDLPDTPNNGTRAEFTRESLSPLSSVRSSMERELERTLHPHRDSSHILQVPDEVEENIQQPQRARKVRVLIADATTEIANSEIRQQQQDRSKILKPVSFLPRNPVLVALTQMQKDGAFVSSVLGEERTRGWAPELRDLFSINTICNPRALKRKRMIEAGESYDLPLVQIHDESAMEDFGGHIYDEQTVRDTVEVTDLDQHFELPALISDEARPIEEVDTSQDSSDEVLTPERELSVGCEGSTPGVIVSGHMLEDGVMAHGTRNTIYLLREVFKNYSGGENESVYLQDLLPQDTTTKIEATKMFFEILVLATKDAVKVKQDNNELGGRIQINAKRALWADWINDNTFGEQPAATFDAVLA